MKKSIPVILLLLVGCCVISAQTTNVFTSTNITKAQVQAVMDAIDKALVKKDAAAVVANYAGNAVITAITVEDGRRDKTKHGRDDYKRSLEAGFTSFTDYSLQRKNVAIEVALDGKTASCISTLVEKYRFAGKMQEAVSRETTSFVLENGKILVTKDNSDINIK